MEIPDRECFGEYGYDDDDDDDYDDDMMVVMATITQTPIAIGTSILNG